MSKRMLYEDQCMSAIDVVRGLRCVAGSRAARASEPADGILLRRRSETDGRLRATAMDHQRPMLGNTTGWRERCLDIVNHTEQFTGGESILAVSQCSLLTRLHFWTPELSIHDAIPGRYGTVLSSLSAVHTRVRYEVCLLLLPSHRLYRCPDNIVTCELIHS